MKVANIGLGLIGGSFALALQKHFPDVEIWGIDQNPAHIEAAVARNIIHHKGEIDQLQDFDLIVVSIPVDAASNLITSLLDQIQENSLIIDMGSTKNDICKAANLHSKRNQFLALHPIAGTEFSGPKAAFESLFEDATMIICEADKTDEKLKKKAYAILQKMKMQLHFMSPEEHDKHLAYVSHLSHVSSFMLGKTVLDLEKNEREIFNLAGSGFASTVRLAKSNPKTWASIFKQNKKEVLTSLKEYQQNLKEFEKLLEADKFSELELLLDSTSRIKEILAKK
jgi:prephenate dehydrogenase